MKLFARALLASLSVFAPPVLANTWVVDDTPGPGVDFNSIAAATAVAAPGDLIVVRAGTYPGFTLGVGAVVLGESVVMVTGAIHVTGVADGQRASLVNLSVGSVFVENCIGGITLEELIARFGGSGPGQSALWNVTNSVDVRLRSDDVDLGLDGLGALLVDASRVEVTSSRLIGGSGRSHDVSLYPGAPEPGGDGIVITGSADVHVSLCTVQGGEGGNLPTPNLCPGCTAGAGGLGIRLGAGARVIVTGSGASLVSGGIGGIGPQCNIDGRPGNGIVAQPSATVRASGSPIQGASTRAFCGAITMSAFIGPYTIPAPPDPTLIVSGNPQPGQPLTFTITGEPGASARMSFGRGMFVADIPFVVEDLLTSPVRTFELGVLPASGQLSLVIPLPGYFPRGLLIVAQGTTQSTGVGVSFTPSIPITLR